MATSRGLCLRTVKSYCSILLATCDVCGKIRGAAWWDCSHIKISVQQPTYGDGCSHHWSI